jgi:carboxyl-terminal processing protease
MADLFLDSGVIVSVRPRVGEEVSYSAHRTGTLPDFPMIVIVNGSSASASEIVSGALQDNGRAKVLGTRTFGKGSVQEVRQLPYGGGTLKFTTAHYFLPSGRNLNRNPDSETWGVDPDPGLVVPVTDDAYIQGFIARREYEIIREPDAEVPACVSAAWIREQLKDEQLAVAVETLDHRLAEGDWPAVSDESAGRVAFSQELSRASEARVRLLDQLRQLDERIGEMEGKAAEAGRPPLLPEGVDLVNGTLTIRDRDGNVIGSYVIEGGDVDLALNAMELRPREGEGGAGERD